MYSHPLPSTQMMMELNLMVNGHPGAIAQVVSPVTGHPALHLPIQPAILTIASNLVMYGSSLLVIALGFVVWHWIRLHQSLRTLQAALHRCAQERAEATQHQQDATTELELLFTQSLDGFFVVRFDQPIDWDNAIDQAATLDAALMQLRLTRANQAFLDQYGATSDIIGQPLVEWMADDGAQSRVLWHQLFTQGRLHIDAANRKLDGTPIWIDGNYICLYDDQHRLTGYLGIQRASDRNQAEAELYQLNQHLENLVRQRTADLHQSEQRFRQMAENIQEVFWMTVYLTPEQPTMLYVSPVYETIWGRSLAELYQNPLAWIEAIHPDDRSVLQHMIQCPLPTSFEVEYRIIQPNGSVRWIRDRGFPVPANGAELQRVAGVAEDITERKQTEFALRDSEERLRMALKAANQGLYDLNIQTGAAIVSPEYATMLGYDPATFHETNAAWIDRLHPDDREPVAAVYQAYITGEIPEYKVEFRQRTQSGDWKWILSLGKVVAWDANGQPLRMLGTHTDLSDRKQIEAALRESEHRYAQILDSVQDMVFCKDPNSVVLYANQATCNYYGMTVEQLRGMTDVPFNASEHTHQYLQDDQQVFATAQPVEVLDEPNQRADGEIRYFHTIKSPILTTEGTVVQLVGVSRDITERKQIEASLRVRAQQQSAVAQLGQLGLATTELSILMERATALMVESLAVDYGCVLELLPDDGGLLLRAGVGWQPELVGQTILSVDTASQAGYTLAVKAPVVVEDLQTESRFSDTALLRDHHVVSGLSVIIQGGDRPFGILSAHSTHRRRFTQDDVNFLQAVANILTTAIERRRTEESLQASEAELRAVFAAMTDVVVVRDRQGRCLKVAPTNASTLYKPVVEMLNATVHEIFPKPQADSLINGIHTALSTHQTIEIDYCLEIDDRVVWFAARISPMTDDSVVIVARDISDRKYAENELRKTLNTNQALIHAIPDLILRISRDGVYIDAIPTQTVQPILPVEELVGQRVQTALPPDLAHQRMHCIEQAFQTGVVQTHEYQIWLDGELRHEEARIVKSGPDEVIVLIRDISDRKRAEAEVRQLNEQLEQQNRNLERLVEQRTAELTTFINTLPDYIYVINREDMRILFCNDLLATTTLFGHRAVVEGKTIFDCFPAEQAAYFHEQNQQVFATGETLHQQESIVVEGHRLHFDTYKIPLKRPNGEVYALIGSSRDITELVEARQALTKRTRQLEVINQELQSFSYSVSHDLRAPLRHISGFVGALRDELNLSQFAHPKAVHYIETIESSSQKMGQLIDGLLMLSRLGRRQMEMQPVELRPLVEQAINLIRENSPASHPTEFKVGELPIIYGDATLLQQVFSNLLSNAVKFSRNHPHPVVEIGRLPEDTIYIKDNGVGFDMQYASKLFGTFQRLHSQREFEGTGIGLAIVQRIINRHGGAIWAESELGHGATFYLKFESPTAAPSSLLL